MSLCGVLISLFLYFSYVIYHASWQPVPRACCGPRDANEMHPAVVRPPQQASRWHSAKLLQHKRALPRHDEVASSSRSLRQTSPARMDHHRNRPDCWGDRSASSVLRTPTPARLTNSAILRTTSVSPSNGRGRRQRRVRAFGKTGPRSLRDGTGCTRSVL